MQNQRTFGRRGPSRQDYRVEHTGDQDQWRPPADRWASRILTGCGVLFVAVIAFGTTRGMLERMQAPEADVAVVAAEAPPARLATPAPEPAPVEPCGATMAEFSRLRTGMSYRDAVRIIGCEGTEVSRVEIAGTTVMYMWEGTDTFIGNMNATFDDDRLVSKAQLGLK